MRPRVPVTAVAIASTALLAGTARAHATAGTRLALPIPPVAVAVLAGLLVLTVPAVRRRRGDPGRSAVEVALLSVPAAAGRAVRHALRLGTVLALAGVIALGLVGGPPPTNPVPELVWVVGLHGLAILAILGGDHWSTVSPWRSLYDGLSWLEGEPLVYRSYPDWLGRWPAVAVVVGGGIALVTSAITHSPRLTALTVTLYTAVMLVGAILFGPTWLDRADGLAVLYRLLGSASPLALRRSDAGWRLVGRLPWRHPPGVEHGGAALVVVVAHAIVLADGLAEAPRVGAVLVDPWVVGGVLLGFAGAAWTGGGAIDRWATGERPTGTLVAVASVLLPALAAVELATGYAPLLDAMGNLVGVGDPLWWLSLAAFWSSQVLIVVGGHAVAATILASETGGPAREIRRWLLAAVIGTSTAVSVWIVSRPLVV